MGNVHTDATTYAKDAQEALRDSVVDAVRTAVDTSVEGVFQEFISKASRCLAEAVVAAAQMKAAGKKEAEGLRRQGREDRALATREASEMRRETQTERVALEKEKAAMEKAHSFQSSKIFLDVGGHKFTTSRQTLTSIPDTYFASFFSGRFQLTPDAEGAYFIDRDGRHFHHILNFLRDSGSFELSSDLTEGQRKELAVEMKFYGLLERMVPMTPSPYLEQERFGRALLQHACLSGDKLELQKGMALAGALVFDMGSTTSVTAELQDLQFTITDRVFHSWPVWAEMGGKWLMFCDADGNMMIGPECVEGQARGVMYNTTIPAVVPTDLPSNAWVVHRPLATLESQHASSRRLPAPYTSFVCVPSLHITAVHGLDGADPMMMAANQQLAALA